MSHETEQLVQCPYNTAHTILRYRMQTHLHKCRKQHESLDWGRCNFNTTHEMPRSEVNWHERYMCPDRHSFFAKRVEFDAPAPSLAPIEQIELPQAEENWDDGAVNFFDPAANAEKRSLIRGVHCVPPAERKAFKSAHRRHIQDNAEDVVTSARLKKPRDAQERDRDREQEQERRDAAMGPVRPPKELPKGYTGPGTPGRAPAAAAAPAPAPQQWTSYVPQSPASQPGAQWAASQPSSPPRDVQWTGYGRGRPLTAPGPGPAPRPGPPGPGPAPAAVAPIGAWGRGRPQF